jgi:haloalkane dehalogenase
LPYPDYPFEPRAVVREGLKQSYLDEGEGPAVLMLHGNPSWSYYYRHLVLGLRDRYRCIVPDHIGMGLSDKPDDEHYRFTLARRVEDLGALVDHLTAKRSLPERGLTLVLHDWGGMIGMAWAAKFPERVARLVILNTAAFPNPRGRSIPLALRLGRDSRIGAWSILKHNAFARGAARFGVRNPMPEAVRAAYLAPYDSENNRLATLRFVQDIPLGPADPGFDLVAATAASLDRFAALPALICWGMHDFVFDRRFLAEWRRHLPRAEVHEFADAGHYVLEDAHASIVPLVREFLERTPAGAEASARAGP